MPFSIMTSSPRQLRVELEPILIVELITFIRQHIPKNQFLFGALQQEPTHCVALIGNLLERTAKNTHIISTLFQFLTMNRNSIARIQLLVKIVCAVYFHSKCGKARETNVCT